MKQPFALSFLQALIPIVYGLLQVGVFWLDGEILWIQVTLLIVGIVIGEALLFADRLSLYRYYDEGRSSVPNLVTRSVLFMLALVPLGVFILSSTGSRLGAGVLLGLVAGLASEVWWYRGDPNLFHELFLFQVKRRLDEQEVQVVVYSLLSLVALITFLLFK